MAGHSGVRDASLLLGPTLVSISLVLTERVRGKAARELHEGRGGEEDGENAFRRTRFRGRGILVASPQRRREGEGESY